MAVVGAIGLVVAALFVRSLLAGDSDGSSGSSERSLPVVACAPDLDHVCDALVDDGLVRAAPAALDLAGAADPDPTIDAWITWDPAPGVANLDAPDTWGAVTTLASAPLGVLVAGGPDACTTTADWACVVTLAENGLAVGTGDGTTAESLARLHAVGAALVPDEGDFTEISPIALRQVVQSPQVRQSDAADQITIFLTRRGALSAVIGPVAALQAAAARQPTATVTQPEPGATAQVVLATSSAPAAGGGAARPTLSAGDLLASEAARAALESLGLEPGLGEPAAATTAGEVYSLREKLR
jgi:hypothetical protein